MATVLMAYATADGQTRKIVEYVGRLVREAGHEPLIADVAEAPDGWSLAHPDAVLLAASVHAGRHADAAVRFVQQQLPLLASVPSAFLSVSLCAAGDAAKCAEAERYLQAFLEESGWRPDLSGTVAGALCYTRYGFLKRQLMKQIAGRGGLPTDVSRDHEFTDWEQVQRFAGAFLERVGAATTAGAAAP